ncbi:hypothetical protein HDU82_003365, partial [Entophlyctis luteolus]
MVQCDACLVWQHTACFGLSDNLPDSFKYLCDRCKKSLRYRTKAMQLNNHPDLKNMVLPPQQPTSRMSAATSRQREREWANRQKLQYQAYQMAHSPQKPPMSDREILRAITRDSPEPVSKRIDDATSEFLAQKYVFENSFEEEYLHYLHTFAVSAFNDIPEKVTELLVKEVCCAVEQELLEAAVMHPTGHVPRTTTYSSIQQIAWPSTSAKDSSAVPDLTSVEQKGPFPDWSTERICVMPVTTFVAELEDPCVAVETVRSPEIPHPSAIRHIGLFATANIPANKLISQISGSIVTPASLSRPSKVCPNAEDESTVKAPLLPVFTELESSELRSQSETKANENLLPAVLTRASSNPADISSGLVAPPFCFPHPSRLASPLVVDAREISGSEADGASGRHARWYCGGDDSERMGACNAVLRSIYLSSAATNTPPGSWTEVAVAGNVPGQALRLGVFSTREIRTGEEIVLWGSCCASARVAGVSCAPAVSWVGGFPCICDPDEDDCLVSGGIEAQETAIAASLPANAPSATDAIDGLSGREGDIVDVVGENSFSAAKADKASFEAIAIPRSSTVDACEKPAAVDTEPVVMSIFKDEDAAKKWSKPASSIIGGKKAWLKACQAASAAAAIAAASSATDSAKRKRDEEAHAESSKQQKMDESIAPPPTLAAEPPV